MRRDDGAPSVLLGQQLQRPAWRCNSRTDIGIQPSACLEGPHVVAVTTTAASPCGVVTAAGTAYDGGKTLSARVATHHEWATQPVRGSRESYRHGVARSTTVSHRKRKRASGQHSRTGRVGRGGRQSSFWPPEQEDLWGAPLAVRSVSRAYAREASNALRHTRSACGGRATCIGTVAKAR